MIRIEAINSFSPSFAIAKSIRNQVFIIEQMVDKAEEYDEYEDIATHLLAFSNNLPVGTCRFRITDKGYKLERFAVLAQHRRKGAAEALLSHCLLAIPKGSLMYLHAQIDAMPLYQKLGFEPLGDLFYECNIAHYKMQKIND